MDICYGKKQFISKDEEKRSFHKEHIPHAVEIKSEELQSIDSDYNFFDAERLKKVFLSKGIDSKTNLLIYSDGIIASSRVALAAYWLGVDQVNILLGGIEGWKKAGYPVTSAESNIKIKNDFGCEVPKRPEILLSTPEDVINYQKQNKDFLLVNVRSWEEYSGQTSGYPYISIKGAPKGSVYAKSTTHRTNVDDIINEEGQFGDLDQLKSEWKKWGITPDKDLAFFCGAGWRAAAVFFYLKEMGWQNLKVYDGGWYQWTKYHQENPEKYPTQSGDPFHFDTI